MMQDLKEKLKQPTFQLAVLFGSLVAFLITNAILRDTSLSFLPFFFAILIVVEIAAFVGMEVKEGAQKHGLQHEIVDTIVALIVAVAIWYGFSFVLNTSSPISGVVSCSMLPNLQRGDFVVVQGAQPKAYDINMSQAQLDSLSNSPDIVSYNNTNTSISGSLFAYCLVNNTKDVCQTFIYNPTNITETKGAFTYKYQSCAITLSNNDVESEPCLTSIIFNGNNYLTNFSNDIIVYQPNPGDLFSQIGDIVHRVMFKINVNGSTYYLTRGDNNPVLDLQAYDYTNKIGNHPVPQSQVRGKVISRIPYLGYFKLFISGYFQEDPQCKTQLTFTHVT